MPLVVNIPVAVSNIAKTAFTRTIFQVRSWRSIMSSTLKRNKVQNYGLVRFQRPNLTLCKTQFKNALRNRPCKWTLNGLGRITQQVVKYGRDVTIFFFKSDFQKLNDRKEQNLPFIFIFANFY